MKITRTITAWLVTALFFLHLQAKAQVNISAQILPPYPTKISDYASHPQLMLIAVTNTSTTPQRIQLRGNITGDNGIEIRVKNSYKSRTPLILNSGETRTLNGNDLNYFFDYTQLTYTGITQAEFIAKNGLPEGTYRFCVRAYNYDSNAAISMDEPLGCSNTFSIASLEPPVILSPMDQDSIISDHGQIFSIRWNTPGTTPPSIRYRVRMVEVLGNKNPNNAIMSATQPYFFEKQDLTTNSYIYNPADPMLTPGRRYALMVEAYDPFNQITFRNKGRSEVISFVYKKPAITTLAAVTPLVENTQTNTHHSHQITHEPSCDCTVTVPAATTDDNKSVMVNSKIKVNNFIMNVVSVSKQSDGNLSGTGTVAMPFIGSLAGASLRVTFSDLMVSTPDANGKFMMLDGRVDGVVSGNAVGFTPPQDEPMAVDPLKLNDLGNYLKNTTDHLLTNIKNSASPLGFELPLSMNLGPVNVGIMRIHFTAKQTWFDAAAAMDIPDGFTKIALMGKDICMRPDNLCGQGQLFLGEDLNVSAINLTLKKHNENVAASGTSILFDAQGFKSLHIDAQYKFPEQTLVKTGTSEAATLDIKTDTEKGWDDWVAYATIDPFHINGVADFKFSLGANPTDDKKIIYDHSSTKNAGNMPTHIDSGDGKSINTGSPTWEGLFIPSLVIQLPAAIKGKNNQPIKIEASNLIFDGGFTGYIHTLTPPLTLGSGNLGGWFFSIDNIGLSFFQGSFTSGGMNGKFMLPASGKDTTNTQNQITYNCNLASSGGGLNYTFVVDTKKDLNFSALWAKVTIDGGSNITITGGSNSDFKISALLNGSMVVQPDISNLPDLTLGYLTFQNMKFSTTDGFSPGQFGVGLGSPPATGALFNDGPVYGMLSDHGPNTVGNEDNAIAPGDASNQSLMGFNFSVDKVSPLVEAGKLGIAFDTKMQLVNGVSWIPKASLGFSIYAKLNAGDGSHTWWDRVGGDINAIELKEDANLAGMKLTGFIRYFNTAPDRGFAGALQVTLPGTGMTIGMKGLFGSRKQETRSFQYFYVDAMFDLGKSGIMMYPGTALYGFAGGAYYNMQRVEKTLYANKGAAMPDPGDNKYVQMQSISGATYTPLDDGGSSFGFNAGVYFGLQSRNVFEGKVVLTIGFKNGSLNEVDLDGDADVLNDGSFEASTFEDRYAKALGQIHVGVSVKFNNGHFWKLVIQGQATLKYPAVNPFFTATGANELYIENMAASDQASDQNVRWYFKAGVPWDAPAGQPMSLTLDAKIFKVGAQAYFEVGNFSIDNVPALPPLIQNILNTAKNENNGGHIDNNASQTMVSKRNESDSGVIFGAMVGFDAHPTFAIFYADLKAALGADFGLKFYDTAKGEAACSTSKSSWYATGDAFIGAEASCGVHINVFGIKKDIEFVKAGVAAVITAGGPSPIYAQGILGGYFSVLDGLVHGNFSINFTVGTVCSNVPDSDQLTLIASLNPGKDEEVTTLTRPAVSFNFPLSSDFVVPLVDAESHATSYTLFRFDKDYLTTDITGGTQHFTTADLVNQWGSKKEDSRGFGQPIYSLFLASDAPTLLPLTEYTFIVKAKVKKYILSDWIVNKEAVQPLVNKMDETSFKWVMDGNKVYEDSKTLTFKTDKGPTNISIDNVLELLPYHRQQGLPVNAFSTINGGMGYIKLKQPMDANSFNLKVSNPQAFIRFVKAEQGSASVNEIPVTLLDGGATWQFPMPHLDPSSVYALKVFFRGDAQSQPSQNPTQLVARLKYASLAYKVSDRNLITNALAMKANEQEMLTWYFKTGASNNYQDKFNSMQLTKMSVGGAVADIKNTTAINLSNFDWAPNEATKTVKTFGVEYEFKASEEFNSLDVDDRLRNKILPPAQQFDTKLWKNMLGRAGLDSYANNVKAFDQLLDDFMLVAFGPGKKLSLDMPNTKWNPVVGSIHSTTSIDYPQLSPLLQNNLYGINFKNNNYGQPDANPSGQSAGSAGTASGSSSQSGKMISAINSGNAIGQLNTTAGSYFNAMNSGPDYIIHVATTHDSGEGLVSGSNTVIQKIIQAKKDLGYPPDIFSNLPGFGAAYDKAQNRMQTGTTMTIAAPGKLVAPQVKIIAPKAIQQR